jgi:hypothetical protein
VAKKKKARSSKNSNKKSKKKKKGKKKIEVGITSKIDGGKKIEEEKKIKKKKKIGSAAAAAIVNGAASRTKSVHRIARIAMLASAALGIAGCATGEIFRTHKTSSDGIDAADLITTDARQRVIINSDISSDSTTGLVDPVRMTCTEPSPDVATAAATSLGAALGKLGVGSGSFSYQHVEALAQLVERTASIQLLRDKMYQTCLAYANGAITGTTYTVVMSQLDDTILSLMIAETAGGAFGRQLASVSTTANSEARATLIGLPAGVEELSSLTDDLAAAQEKVDAQEAIVGALKAADKDSEEAKKLPDEEKKLAGLIAARDEILKRLQSRAETLAKGNATATATAGGALTERTSALIAAELEEMQKSFLSEGVGDSIVVACLSELGLAPGDIPNEVRNSVEEQIWWREKVLTEGKDAGDSRSALEQNARNEAAYGDAIALLTGKELTGRGVRSELGDFCEKNLEDIVITLNDNTQELQKLRIANDATEVKERLALAASDVEKYRAEQMRIANESLKICQALTGDAQNTCLDRLPIVSAPAAPAP